MKRWLTLMLLAGAFLGLFGQASAFAMARPMDEAPSAVAMQAMSPDCSEMADGDTPCQGLTLECIVKMGCAIAPAIITPDSIAVIPGARHDLVSPLVAVRLMGRSVGPEPEPPLLRA